jgi:hypothetical protein
MKNLCCRLEEHKSGFLLHFTDGRPTIGNNNEKVGSVQNNDVDALPDASFKQKICKIVINLERASCIQLADEALPTAPEMLLSRDSRGHTPFDYERREHWPNWVIFLNENRQFIVKSFLSTMFRWWEYFDSQFILIGGGYRWVNINENRQFIVKSFLSTMFRWWEYFDSQFILIGGGYRFLDVADINNLVDPATRRLDCLLPGAKE